MNAIVMVQPKDSNVKHICENLSRFKRSFKNMFITFTNEPTEEHITLLAKADRNGVVKSVRTFYGEYSPVANNLIVTTNGEVDQLGDFIKKIDVRPSGIFFKGSVAEKFCYELHKNLKERKFSYNKEGVKPRSSLKKAPV